MSDQLAQDLTDLAHVLDLALEDIDHDTDHALRAADRLAARMESRQLQAAAQELLSWPERFRP